MSDPGTTLFAAVEAAATELSKLEALIAGAHRLLAEGRVIELSALDNRTRTLCKAVLDLPGPEGRAMIAKLEKVLDSLDGLSAAMQEKFGDMPVMPSHGNAAAAYASLLKHFP